MTTMRRRQVLHAGLGVAVLSVTTEGTSLADAPAPGTLARVIARVGKNHGHVLTIPLADVTARVEKTFDLTGTAAHPHAVTLTIDQLAALRAGAIVRARSTESMGHAHRLWVRCAPAEDPPEWVTACKATFTGRDEHEIVIPAADLASTTDRRYDVQGLAGHTHALTLTAADFDKLRRGGPVTHPTSRLEGDAHLHTVTIEVLRKPR